MQMSVPNYIGENRIPFELFEQNMASNPLASIDETVRDPYGLHTIRNMVPQGKVYTEIEGSYWLGAVTPRAGDHFFLECWGMTAPNPNITDTQGGIRFGFDFFGRTIVNSEEWFGILAWTETLQAGHPSGQDINGIQGGELRWGAHDWGYTIDMANGMHQTTGLVCRIPHAISGYNQAWMQCDGYVPTNAFHVIGHNDVFYTVAEDIYIDTIVPWMFQVDPTNSSPAWFGSPRLLINPQIGNQSQLNVNSVPQGIPITIDGQQFVTPVSRSF